MPPTLSDRRGSPPTQPASDYWYAPPGPRGGARVLLPGQRAAAAVPDGGGAARARSAELPAVDSLFGWTGDGRRRRTTTACAVAIATATARARTCSRPTTSSAATAAARWCARGRHRAQRHRLRPAHGARRVPLERAARGRSSAFRRPPTYRVLQPELQGYWQFFGRIDVRRRLLLPRAGAGGRRRATTSTSTACWRRRPASRSTCEFDHVGFWDLRVTVASGTAPDASSSPATPRTSTRPTAASASTPAWRTPPTSGWKLAARCRLGRRRLAAILRRRAPPDLRGDRGGFHRRPHQADGEVPRALRSPEARPRPRIRAGVAARRAPTSARACRAYEPNYEGSPVIDRPARRRELAPTARISSRRAPAITCAAAAVLRPASCSRSCGPDFTLLAFDADDAGCRPSSSAAQALGVPLKSCARHLTATAAKLRGAAHPRAAGPVCRLDR